MATQGNLVRDMYEGVNPRERSEMWRKAHRDQTLQNNPDVLFRINRRGSLHVLLLHPTDYNEWMRAILNRIPPRLSFQLTMRSLVNGHLRIINISGPEDDLEHICDDFDQIYDEVTINIQNRAAQRDIEAELEEARVRIRELELENNMLQRRLLAELQARGQ